MDVVVKLAVCVLVAVPLTVVTLVGFALLHMLHVALLMKLWAWCEALLVKLWAWLRSPWLVLLGVFCVMARGVFEALK